MKTLVRKKILANGTVELRSYEINSLLRQNKSVKVIIDNPDLAEHDTYMILTPSQLKKGVVNNTQFSKFNPGQTYLLMEYLYKGKNIEREEEISIDFHTKKRMSEMWKNILQKTG